MLNYIEMWILMAQLKLKEFCTKEDGDVNIVSIVVLIGIAVVLAMFFKDEIADLLKSMFGAIETNVDSVFEEVS